MMEVAKAVALSGDGVGGRGKDSFRLGAVLFDKRGRVVASGTNSYKTHPKLAPFTEYPFIHAEQACLLKYGLDNCEGLCMMVVRVLKDGSFANAKPCSVCSSLLRACGVRDVYYSTKEGKVGNL